MAVIFGIYDRIIRDVSKLREYLIKDIWFILTVGIGGLIGIIICAKGLDFLIEQYEIPIMFFFASLILVQIPDIWKTTDNGEKMTTYNIAALVIGFVIMIGILYLGTVSAEEMESPGVIVLVLAGVLYAVCALSPGISGSTILLALGLFNAVIGGLSDLDLSNILPLIIGAVVGVLLFSKVIDHFVTHNRKSTYCVILGLTAGSVVTVIAEAFMKMGADDVLIPCAIAVVCGLAIGYVIHIFSKHYSPESSE